MGLPSEGEGTPRTHSSRWNSCPANRAIRVRGRIDRVDEVPASAGTRYSLWDYKTGGT